MVLWGDYITMMPYQRRQKTPKAYQPNGAIYAFSVDEFKRYNHFPRTQYFRMLCQNLIQLA